MLRSFRRSASDYAFAFIRRWVVRLVVLWIIERVLLAWAKSGPSPPGKSDTHPEPPAEPSTSSERVPPTE